MSEIPCHRLTVTASISESEISGEMLIAGGAERMPVADKPPL